MWGVKPGNVCLSRFMRGFGCQAERFGLFLLAKINGRRFLYSGKGHDSTSFRQQLKQFKHTRLGTEMAPSCPAEKQERFNYIIKFINREKGLLLPRTSHDLLLVL